MPRQRIFLVDDHEVGAPGLKALIERQPDMEVVAEAATAAEAVTKALAFKPDVVVMDIRLARRQRHRRLPRDHGGRCRPPRSSCSPATPRTRCCSPPSSAGAAGYVLKQAGGQDVVRALNAVAEGHSLLDPALTERVFAEVRRAARAQEVTAFAPLTEQERRVLALVADGRTNREIAQELHLGEGTVRNYVSNILSKLGVSNRAEAAAYATKHHLQAPEENPPII